MPKKAAELTPLAISRLGTPGLHAAGGVAGLHLQVAPGGARTWILRVTVGAKRRDMGLGGYPDVPLAMAREKARAARLLVEQGIDPILQRQQAKSALAAEQASEKTFERCAREYIAAKSAGWSNPKHAQQWTNTLETYAFPTLGPLLVGHIKTANVEAALKPIWTTKTETATRVRGRIEAVLGYATVHHYREGPNPACWRGHLDKPVASARQSFQGQASQSCRYRCRRGICIGDSVPDRHGCQGAFVSDVITACAAQCLRPPPPVRPDRW